MLRNIIQNKIMINICTVVTGNNLDQFIKNLKMAQKVSNFVELRVDYIINFKIDDIKTIQKYLTKKAIFTCRTKKEGGNFNGTEKERVEIIQQALKSNFDFVDIELITINKVNLKNKSKKTKIICSHHDFKKTPTLKSLIQVINNMRKTKCDIMKIATEVKKMEDNLILFKLLFNKKKKEKMIVLGMGKLGKITRILAPLHGSYLTFASIGKNISAPGQMDVKQLEKIYIKLINSKCKMQKLQEF